MMHRSSGRYFVVHLVLAVLVCSGAALAQKVKTEYDKKTDFNRFKTYNWARKNDQYLRPLLAAVVMERSTTICRE